VDFVPNFGKFGAQQVLDFPASMSTPVSQIKELLDFLQRESESLHLFDKSEPGYVICRISPKLSYRPECSWQQRPALIEADGVDAQFGPLRSFADLDRAAQTLQSVWHKEIIHSRLYSRVKSSLSQPGDK
jgi:hypothetical protein